MKSIVFITCSKELAEDVQVANQFDFGTSDYTLTVFDSLDGIEENVRRENPDLVVLSYDAFSKRDSWSFGDAQVAYHASNRTELNKGAEKGYPTIGIAESAEDILKKLGEEPYAASAPKQAPKQATKKTAKKKAPVKKPEPDDEFEDDEPMEIDFKDEEEEADEEPDDDESDEEDDEFEEEDEDFSDEEEPEPPKPQKTGQKRKPKPESRSEKDENVRSSTKRTSKKSSATKESASERLKERAVPKPKHEEAEYEEDDYIEQEFKKDLINRDDKKTKVVTVYSAKGGVGKTTIATELAVYLSLVSIGRRKLKVCLVDYNIDFGDVRMTLNLSPKHLNLTHWASEVQELMENGRSADEIEYSREEMEEYLTLDKKSGLHVLQAPVTNEDSMSIDSESLSIILDNLIENGGFDYVICDTGNNTRDSTMIALEHADIILMIMTQNANTANCDKAFMSTMETINFDLSNAKLIINNIMPQKATKISVQEIIDFFPFECVGKIKFNTDVIKATNTAEPLAYQPDHEFTKQLRSIVTYILQQDDYEVGAPQKKKLFDFFKKG